LQVPQKNSAFKIASNFRHSKFINFTVETAAKPTIIAAISWSVAASQLVSLCLAGGHWRAIG